MRIVLLAAMALAFSNSLCLSTCLVEECTAAAKHSGCPQHQRPQQTVRCNPQPAASEYVNDFPALVVEFVAIADLRVALSEIGWDSLYLAPESPPGGLSISVLRV